MILQIVDVRDIGRYEDGSSFGFDGLSTGMIKACFHSVGSIPFVHVMFNIRRSRRRLGLGSSLMISYDIVSSPGEELRLLC